MDLPLLWEEARRLYRTAGDLGAAVGASDDHQGTTARAPPRGARASHAVGHAGIGIRKTSEGRRERKTREETRENRRKEKQRVL